MSDNTELKRLASEVDLTEWYETEGGAVVALNYKAACFIEVASPAAVLALIAENDAMACMLQRFVDGEYDQEENQAERHMYFTEAQSLLALMNGELEAHTIVPDSAIKAIHAERDQLKAESEALHSLLREMRSIGNHAPAELTLRVDAALGKGGQS